MPTRPIAQEVCCLPGAQVRERGIFRRFPGLIQFFDFYPLLVVQVNSDEVEERSPRTIRKGFGALG